MKRRFNVYVNRNCEVCGSSKHTVLCHSIDVLNEMGGIVEIEVKLVSCSGCGFVFMNPTPSQDELNRYYANIPALFQPELLYSIDNRLCVIKKFLRNNIGFLEIGGNNAGAFHSRLKELFERTHSFDVNTNCDSLPRDQMNDMPEYSMAGLYYVLEHIPNVGKTISDISKKILYGGHVLIEVPNIHEYAYDISSFI